jgi:NADPH:quinone reductase-like Zn-dependent oxidoreductase
MKAFQLMANGTPGKFQLRDVAEPNFESGEVVVAVEACGVNHLDLWLEEGGLPMKVKLPRTPGSEISGVISAVGNPVASGETWKIGERVAVQSNLFCGQCEFCQEGHESLCLKSQLLGVDRDGGFAEKVVVPASSLIRLPRQVSFETSAALTLAGSTAMHMLTDRTSVKADSWVLVMGGSSGVGSAAIQIAKGLGARVISLASTDEKRSLARRLGAEFVLNSNDPAWPGDVRRVTGKRGVDLVVEHLGGEFLTRSFECLARGGTIVTCGATTGREITLNIWPLFVKQQRLVGSYGRNRADMIKTLEWAAAGKLTAVIDSTFPLDHAADAFAALRERRILGKAVVLIR